MTHTSLITIRHEHRALSAMLRSVLLLLDDHRRRGTLPDFAALRAMLFYVDEFPEKLHHPKERRLLFPKLRGYGARSDAVLDRLDRDHARGEESIRRLEHALLGFEMMGETEQVATRRASFKTAIKRNIVTMEKAVAPRLGLVLGQGRGLREAYADTKLMNHLSSLALTIERSCDEFETRQTCST